MKTKKDKIEIKELNIPSNFNLITILYFSILSFLWGIFSLNNKFNGWAILIPFFIFFVLFFYLFILFTAYFFLILIKGFKKYTKWYFWIMVLVFILFVFIATYHFFDGWKGIVGLIGAFFVAILAKILGSLIYDTLKNKNS